VVTLEFGEGNERLRERLDVVVKLHDADQSLGSVDRGERSQYERRLRRCWSWWRAGEQKSLLVVRRSESFGEEKRTAYMSAPRKLHMRKAKDSRAQSTRFTKVTQTSRPVNEK
jgi:hypothetical protein